MIARLTVDLDAIRRNAARLRALIAPARLAAVVKANAYGHGLTPVALALAREVDAFCVYRVEEAALLRAAGIAVPVLVLGPVEPSELDLAHRSRAAIALWSEGAFRQDATRVARRHGSRFAVHAKIDTGVTRLGLDRDRAPAALASYLGDPDLALRGAFTHLAAAEELESTFTLRQLERFESALEPLRAILAERGVIRHAAASAAGMLFPKLRLDLVRAGIALYGIWPSEETRCAVSASLLEPVLTWTTELVVVRPVEAGRPVGYGCSFRTTRASRIGVLPIGYAEGLPRALSNAGQVLVGGRRVPIVGRVCMNMAFVDVTDVPEAAPGMPVTLLGRDGDAQIDPNELAAAAGTIGYELVARLPAEVPRFYESRDNAGDATARNAAARSSVPS
jgi:alanine racemase